MIGISPLHQHPVPWQQVMRAEVYTGPRGGWRVCMSLACGHTMSRPANPGERKTQRCATSVARCWVCWWKGSKPFPTPNHYHR